MNRAAKRIEVLANLATIVAACVFAGGLIRQCTQSSYRPSFLSANNQGQKEVIASLNLSQLGIDWSRNKQTLVMVLSNQCHFCTESAPFYRKLTEIKNGTRLIAILPQDRDSARAYLERLGVSVDEMLQSDLSNMGVRGTPTLVLVKNDGVVRDTWLGKLSPQDEEKLIGLLR